MQDCVRKRWNGMRYYKFKLERQKKIIKSIAGPYQPNRIWEYDQQLDFIIDSSEPDDDILYQDNDLPEIDGMQPSASRDATSETEDKFVRNNSSYYLTAIQLCNCVLLKNLTL